MSKVGYLEGKLDEVNRLNGYWLTIHVEGRGEWYEAAAVDGEPFSEAQIDSFFREVKPILKEKGFMKDD